MDETQDSEQEKKDENIVLLGSHPGTRNAKNIKMGAADSLAMKIVNKWKKYCSEKRAEKNKSDVYRKGPAPIDDAKSLKKSIAKPTYGTLDGDIEDLEFDDEWSRSGRVKITSYNVERSLASSRALILYFSKLGKSKDEDDVININYVVALLRGGADINFGDAYGQTALHEIARSWHPDIAKFAIENGADVNKADDYGRTPLHLASAVNYAEMVEFLIQNGANIRAMTKGELQTPMHFAAKNNATASLKTLLRLGAAINDRDYKMRSPLFVAAETARSEAARYLVEQDAPVGVYDDSGNSCLSLMIEKMPPVALEAVEQFHKVDLAFRKHYFYLSHLDTDRKYLAPLPNKYVIPSQEEKGYGKDKDKLIKLEECDEPKEKTFAKTPLEVIVQYKELDLILHPVFQRLLKVKWDLFGKRGAFIQVGVNLFYTILWTILGILLPREGNYYSPASSNWWRFVLEGIGVLMTIYFIYKEVKAVRQSEVVYNNWRAWRTKNLKRDFEYCHPRWPDEEKFLESEVEQIQNFQRTYFREPWNIIEWISYFVVLLLILTRIMSVASSMPIINQIHPKVYCAALVIIWFRFLRSCRAFMSLGPFIAMFGDVANDTMKFGFILMEFFVPFAVGFWIIFGGEQNSKKMQANEEEWKTLNNVIFSLWQVTLIGAYDWNGLASVDRIMAQIMVALYLMLTSIVCINLYIALLSDTFARVYAQAQAIAAILQTQVILSVESAAADIKKLEFQHHMQDECSPLVISTLDEESSPDDQGNAMFERVVRQVCNRIIELEDNIGQMFSKHSPQHQPSDGSQGNLNGNENMDGNPPGSHDTSGGTNLALKLDVMKNELVLHKFEIKNELDQIRSLMLKLVEGKTPKAVRKALRKAASKSDDQPPSGTASPLKSPPEDTVHDSAKHGTSEKRLSSDGEGKSKTKKKKKKHSKET